MHWDSLRVDSADHAILAVAALTAVKPDGLVVLDADGVGEDLGGCGEGGISGHEA